MKNFIKHTKSWNFLPYCAFRIAIIDNCFPSSCVFDDYWPSIAIMSTLLAIICSSCACIQAAIYRFLVKWLAFMITTGSMLLYFQLVWNTFLIPSFSSRSLLLSLLKRRPSEHEIFSPRRMRQKSMTNFPPAQWIETIAFRKPHFHIEVTVLNNITPWKLCTTVSRSFKDGSSQQRKPNQRRQWFHTEGDCDLENLRKIFSYSHIVWYISYLRFHIHVFHIWIF